MEKGNSSGLGGQGENALATQTISGKKISRLGVSIKFTLASCWEKETKSTRGGLCMDGDYRESTTGRKVK